MFASELPHARFIFPHVRIPGRGCKAAEAAGAMLRPTVLSCAVCCAGPAEEHHGQHGDEDAR